MLFYIIEYKNSDFIFSILSGIIIGFAYLTKEPSIFVIIALIIDTVVEKKWKKLIGLILGCGSIITLEHIYYFIVVNDLLFRSHAMEFHHRAMHYQGLADVNLFDRLIKTYPKMMIIPNLKFRVALNLLYTNFNVIN